MPLAKQSDIEYILNRLNDTKIITYDCETTGLNPFKENVICGHGISFSTNPSDAWYMPVRHVSNNLDNRFEPALLEALDRQDLTIIGHNLHFDLKFLSTCLIGQYKLRAKYIDTMINAALLNEHQASFSLEFCAEQANLTPKKSFLIKQHIRSEFPEATKNEMGHYWRLAGNDPVAVEYACGDNITTFELWEWQKKQIKAEELDKVFKIESRLIPVLARMSAKGIKVNVAYLEKLNHYADAQIEILQNQFPEGFNSRAPSEMRKLFEKEGITDWPLTPTGQPSFNGNFLEKSDLGKKVIALRKLMTLKSMFVEPLINDHMINGRVHTTFNQLRGDGFGVITGRISTQSPGMGQVPKRDKLCGPLFRAAFVPDEDKVWGDADWSQAEPRLLAVYSGSKVLLDDYRNNPNADAHQSVADAAGIERHWGKHANMTIINSGGRNVLMNKYHVPADKVDGLLANYYRVMPEVRNLQRNAANKFKQLGFVRTLLGRKARLANSGKAYTAVNRLLQGGNADCLKLKLVEIDEYLESVGRPVDILNTVHDSISFQFEQEHEEIYKNCLKIMNFFGSNCMIHLSVPFKTDDDIGENWSVATYGSDVRELINEVNNVTPIDKKSKLYGFLSEDGE